MTLAHYLHFFNRNTRWNAGDELLSYLMVKTEVNYITTVNLQHFGEYTQGSTLEAERLRAMTGSVSMINLGINLEYYLNNLQQFVHPYSNSSWNPYVSFGARYVLFNNTLESSLGDWEADRSVLPEKYRPGNAKKIGAGATFAAVIGAGLRYKLTKKLDISSLVSFQFFLSDEVDGLTARVKENRSDERMLNFQIGVVYHLNFNGPLFGRR